MVRAMMISTKTPRPKHFPSLISDTVSTGRNDAVVVGVTLYVNDHARIVHS